jgi:hypothetical protein
MRIGWEVRKPVQNSFFWKRFKAEPIIEAEGGICEVVAGNVSRECRRHGRWLHGGILAGAGCEGS